MFFPAHPAYLSQLHPKCSLTITSIVVFLQLDDENNNKQITQGIKFMDIRSEDCFGVIAYQFHKEFPFHMLCHNLTPLQYFTVVTFNGCLSFTVTQ
jgi:hypothetical protein